MKAFFPSAITFACLLALTSLRALAASTEPTTIDLNGDWAFAYTPAHEGAVPAAGAFAATMPVPGCWGRSDGVCLLHVNVARARDSRWLGMTTIPNHQEWGCCARPWAALLVAGRASFAFRSPDRFSRHQCARGAHVAETAGTAFSSVGCSACASPEISQRGTGAATKETDRSFRMKPLISFIKG